MKANDLRPGDLIVNSFGSCADTLLLVIALHLDKNHFIFPFELGNEVREDVYGIVLQNGKIMTYVCNKHYRFMKGSQFVIRDGKVMNQ